ncbi:uncharacterized protein LOC108601451, partial [Drosophila busckii]|uniref:uncharacterized protein LOC108601451 n=1 Tax=Drosophila busckii TaxID=30019 RepID=UPI00083F0CF6
KAVVACETPRRSTRKSVRPPIDYDDIIERNVMSSASKVKSSALAAAQNITTVAEREEEDDAHKWSAAEVGRHSQKRSRKSKRKQSKKAKSMVTTQPIEREVVDQIVNEDVESSAKTNIKLCSLDEDNDVQDNHEESTVACAQEMNITQSNQYAQVDTNIKTDLSLCLLENEDDQDMQSNQDAQSKADINIESDLGLCPLEIEDDQDMPSLLQPEREKSTVACTQEKNIEKSNLDAHSNIAVACTQKNNVEQSNQDAQSKAHTNIETDLHLCPLENEEDQNIQTNQDAQSKLNTTIELELCPLEIEDDDDMPSLLQDEDDQDMPSLLQVDDSPTVLNRTFDADENSVIYMDTLMLNAEDMECPAPKVPVILENKAIKVVLTTADNNRTTLINLNDNSKPFKFPTPLKSSANFQFSGNTTAANEKFNNDLLNCSERGRRRSKSLSNEKVSNTVSFYSPVETIAVNNKHRKGLDISNITQRRKRSLSADCSRVIESRIPKPKFFQRVATPTKLKTVTKLPNFTAIHQKHFAKMENLVEHVERKKLRAKELQTSSAVKSSVKKRIESITKSSAKKLPAPNVRAASRPRALKKLDVSSVPITPRKASEQQGNLPNPRDMMAKAILPKRLPLSSNISSSAFVFNSAAVSSKDAEPVQSKVQARQQRHMEMFKGRTATKAKNVELIRGVRSNRRFELQMQHRRLQDENKS